MEQKQGTPIIGTHNTMTYLRPQKWYGWFMIPFARCQRKTIEEQWHDGARCFDLRIRFTKQGEPYFAHGLYECTHKVKFIDVLTQLDKLILRDGQRAFVRLILEDPDKQNHNVVYFKAFCQAWETHQAFHTVNKWIHFFGGNRKGDWAQIVEFDYKLNLTQYVGSMMEDARWYEKIMPFAYAWRRNKKNKQNPQGDIAIYDFI
jgi:hypothetical protein